LEEINAKHCNIACRFELDIRHSTNESDVKLNLTL